MSNYYNEEKTTYLSSLAAVRAKGHDLTPFLKFGLKGIAIQSGRLTKLIKNQVSKEIFRNLMHELFARLQSTRKRVIVRRQLMLLEKLLNTPGEIELFQLAEVTKEDYKSRKMPIDAYLRDVSRLWGLEAIHVHREGTDTKNYKWYLSVNLDWPTTITETEFFARLSRLPKSKMYGFLSSQGD